MVGQKKRKCFVGVVLESWEIKYKRLVLRVIIVGDMRVASLVREAVHSVTRSGIMNKVRCKYVNGKWPYANAITVRSALEFLNGVQGMIVIWEIDTSKCYLGEPQYNCVFSRQMWSVALALKLQISLEHAKKLWK